MFGIIDGRKLSISYKKINVYFKNYHLFINTGNAANPCIILKIIENNKLIDTKLIGGIKELIKYMIKNNNNLFLITGFGRANLGRIYSLYIENIKNISLDNNENIKILRKEK